MAAITERFGSGGANLAPGGNQGIPSLASALRDIADDLADTRGALLAVTQQLDADAGVTDVDYESGIMTPLADIRTTKA